MSVETKNVALVRHLVIEVQQNGKFDLIDEFCHPDWVDRTPVPGLVGNRDGVHQVMRHLHTALADIKVDIQQCVCTGDIVATNKVLSGQHVGELFGQSPSNQRVEFRVMDFIRVQDGKLIEHWACAGPITPVSNAS